MSQDIYRSYVDSCDFNVGTLFAHDGFALMLAQECQRLGLRRPFDYAFGSVSCVMQGGRAAPLRFDKEEVASLFEGYAQAGIGCRLTFSNYELAEADLEDADSNWLLGQLSQYPGAGVILSSDLLARYLRDQYPGLQLVSSLVKPTVENDLGQETPQYYNDLLRRYDIAVVNSAFANDDAFLGQIDDLGRVEFIANHRCRPNCPLSKKHYTTQTKSAHAASTGNYLVQRRLESALTSINAQCLRRRQENPLDNSLISAKRVEELVAMGVRHFKIEGRDYPLTTIVRDLGNWVFEPEGVYLSLVQQLLHQPL